MFRYRRVKNCFGAGSVFAPQRRLYYAHNKFIRPAPSECFEFQANVLISKENVLIFQENVLISKENVLSSKENVLISKENVLTSKANALVSKEKMH